VDVLYVSTVPIWPGNRHRTDATNTSMVGHGCGDAVHQSGEVACLIKRVQDVGGGDLTCNLLRGVNCDADVAEELRSSRAPDAARSATIYREVGACDAAFLVYWWREILMSDPE
jgi:hypothetical protein